jgi:hypothetical protein
LSRTDSLAQDALPVIQPRLLRRALTFLGRTYLPLLLFTLVVATAILLRQTLGRRVGWLAALTLFVFSYNAAACLEVAILNSLEVARYVWVQMFFTLPAEFLAVWLLLELLIQRRSDATVSPG